MKTKNLPLLPALISALNLISAGPVTAQTFTTLHSFNISDGDSPVALILSGNTLYGTALNGGTSFYGTVFAVNIDGTGFTNLHNFAYSDGAFPNSALILTNNVLYGTTHGDGSGAYGTVFAINTDGTGFTNLHSFHRGDGQGPNGLVLSGNTLYGAAFFGSVSGAGTIFAVNTDSTGFTNLYNFSANPNGTNSDGAYPSAGLVLSGNTLYGTAENGGSAGNGTVFSVRTDGTGFTNLHSFTALSPFPNSTNSDGAFPDGALILTNSALYGTAPGGGSSGNGTVFAVNTDGTGFTNLYNFSASPNGTNSDGAYPNAGLILSGITLYGTAYQGGSSINGTVFAVQTDGTEFTNLHSFTGGSDGGGPGSGLILSGNALYGAARYGGSSGNGTVFSLSFAPQLTITPSGPAVILSWPDSVAGFDYSGYRLQSAFTHTGPFFSLPGATSPYTYPINSSQRFFRLSQ